MSRLFEHFATAEPKPLYHGTTHRFEVGDTIQPGVEIGKSNFEGGDSSRVFLTADPINAYDWATQGKGVRKRDVRVYRVHAPDAVPTDRYGDEHAASHAVVLADVTNGEPKTANKPNWQTKPNGEPYRSPQIYHFHRSPELHEPEEGQHVLYRGLNLGDRSTEPAEVLHHVRQVGRQIMERRGNPEAIERNGTLAEYGFHWTTNPSTAHDFAFDPTHGHYRPARQPTRPATGAILEMHTSEAPKRESGDFAGYEAEVGAPQRQHITKAWLHVHRYEPDVPYPHPITGEPTQAPFMRQNTHVATYEIPLDSIHHPLRREAGMSEHDYAHMAFPYDHENPDQKRVYLRFGDWPEDERSTNWAMGWKENGVSAYELNRHGEPIDPDGAMDRDTHYHDSSCYDEDGDKMCGLGEGEWDESLGRGNDTREEMQGRVHKAEQAFRNGVWDARNARAHLVTGDHAGFGHDDEPLLTNVKRVGDWIQHRHLFIPTAERHPLALPEDSEDNAERKDYIERDHEHDLDHSALPQHQVTAAKTYSWTGETYGPEGYVTKTFEVPGPLYHGGGKRLREGDQIKPGRKTNPWGDEGPRSRHVYFTNHLPTAASYAEQTGGHVYEVEPTDDFRMDGSGGDGAYKTQHPLNVVRRLDPSEWQTQHTGVRLASYDYQGGHTAPGPDDAPLHDISNVVVGDIYRDAHYYMHGAPGDWYRNSQQASMNVAHRVRNKPNAKVTVYRAVPHHVHDINPGDWVALHPSYARQHARRTESPKDDWKVLKASVPAKHVNWDGNDLNEWGYNGPEIKDAAVHFKGGSRAQEEYHRSQKALAQGRSDYWPNRVQEGLEVHQTHAVTLPEDLHRLVHDTNTSRFDRIGALAEHLRAHPPYQMGHPVWHDDSSASVKNPLGENGLGKTLVTFRRRITDPAVIHSGEGSEVWLKSGEGTETSHTRLDVHDHLGRSLGGADIEHGLPGRISALTPRQAAKARKQADLEDLRKKYDRPKHIDEIRDLLGPSPRKEPEPPQQDAHVTEYHAEKRRQWHDALPGFNPGDDLTEMHPHAEWVPIEVAQRFRDHGGNEGKDRFDRDIEGDLRSGRGMKQPLMLLHHSGLYDGKWAGERQAHLGEGNHRLNAAERAGWTHVPMRVVNMSRFEARTGKGKPIPAGWHKPGVEQTPEMCKPSEVFSREALDKPIGTKDPEGLPKESVHVRQEARPAGSAAEAQRLGGRAPRGPGVDRPQGPGLDALPPRRRAVLRRQAADDGLKPVTFHPRFEKDKRALAKTDKGLAQKIDDTVDALRRGDPNLQTHDLRAPLSGWWSTKVSRGHRLIHQPRDGGHYILGVIDHDDYRDMSRRQASVREDEDEQTMPDHYRDAEGNCVLFPQHDHEHEDEYGEGELRCPYETHHTDWDREYPRLPETLHRGMNISHAQMRAAAEEGGDPHEVVHRLLDHAQAAISRHSGTLGMHWSADEDKAREYAAFGGWKSHRDDPHSVPVVFHIAKPAREHIETDPDRLQERGVIGMDYHDDQEVPLRSRAPVKITGMSWLRSDPHSVANKHLDESWHHHTFAEPISHLAARPKKPQTPVRTAYDMLDAPQHGDEIVFGSSQWDMGTGRRYNAETGHWHQVDSYSNRALQGNSFTPEKMRSEAYRSDSAVDTPSAWFDDRKAPVRRSDRQSKERTTWLDKTHKHLDGQFLQGHVGVHAAEGDWDHITPRELFPSAHGIHPAAKVLYRQALESGDRPAILARHRDGHTAEISQDPATGEHPDTEHVRQFLNSAHRAVEAAEGSRISKDEPVHFRAAQTYGDIGSWAHVISGAHVNGHSNPDIREAYQDTSKVVHVTSSLVRAHLPATADGIEGTPYQQFRKNLFSEWSAPGRGAVTDPDHPSAGVLLHELGHVDHARRQYDSKDPAFDSSGEALHRNYAGRSSGYADRNWREGYAESFAHHFGTKWYSKKTGGSRYTQPGINGMVHTMTANHYAQHYGWAMPGDEFKEES